MDKGSRWRRAKLIWPSIQFAASVRCDLSQLPRKDVLLGHRLRKLGLRQGAVPKTLRPSTQLR
jgi:hypothetical protein